MLRILFFPDIRPAGYPVNPKKPDTGYPTGYRTWLDNFIFGKIPVPNKFIKTALTIRYRLLQTIIIA
jgi:hypothetical protein